LRSAVTAIERAVSLGIVVGLQAEARIAASLGVVAAGGGTPAGAEAAAERLVAGGASALLSFGLAGGLDPALRPGDVVVAAEVIENGRRIAVDVALARRFGTPAGTVLAATRAVTTVADKAVPFAATGALAVDLESGAVARVAARHALPFAVVRAICDPAGRALPAAALMAMDAWGAIRPLRLLAALARAPGEIVDLIALGRDAAAARRALIWITSAQT
jgi:adenosylhomocysteine nucleosidase